MAAMQSTVRLAALADLHVSPTTIEAVRGILAHLPPDANVLLLAGDLTDYGLPEEAHLLARELGGLHIPRLAVLGNHDYESGKQDEVRDILRAAGVVVLD